MKRILIIIALLSLMLSGTGQSVRTVFVDSFNRSYALAISNGTLSACTNNCASPIAYKVSTTASASGSAITSITTTPDYNLKISRTNSTGVPGKTYVTGSLDSFRVFSKILKNNTGPVTWYFNMSHNRTSPTFTRMTGFDSSLYGTATILVSSASNLIDINTKGYAVVLGGSGSGQTYDLVSFSNGLGRNSSLTTLISGLTLGVGNPTYPFRNVVSIKVTYNPITDEWKMYQRDDGLPTVYPSPLTVSDTSLIGSAFSSFQTSATMGFFGFLMNYGVDATTTTCWFDNFRCTVSKPDITILAPVYSGVPPVINRGYYFGRFIYPLGYGPSPEQILTLKGTDLSDTISVTAPLNYELRDTARGNTNFRDSITLYPVDNIYGTKSLLPTSFYVRLKAGLPIGNYDTVRLKFVSAGLFRNDVFCNGTVVDSLTAFLNPSTAELTRFSNTDALKFSETKKFSLSGLRLGGGSVLVSAPADYQVSADSINFSSTLTLIPVSGTLSPTDIFVRFAPSGNRAISYDSILISHPAVSGTVKILVNGYLGSFYYRNGAGSISALSSWKAMPNGSGASPVRFSVPGVYYRIIADSVATNGAWVLDSAAVVVVGDSLLSARSILTIASGFPITAGTLTSSFRIDISGSTGGSGNKLYVRDGTYPVFGIMHSTSEVHLMASKANFPVNSIFGNLFVEGSGVVVNFSGKPVIQKSLIIGSGAGLQTLSGARYGTFTMLAGAQLTNSGTIYVSNLGGFSCGRCAVPAVTPSPGYYVFYFADSLPQCSFSSNSLVTYQAASSIQYVQPYSYGHLEFTNAQITNGIITGNGGNTPGFLTVNNLTLPSSATLTFGSNHVTVNGVVAGGGRFISSALSSLTLGGQAGTIYFSAAGKVIKNLLLNTNATATLGSALEITAGASSGMVTVNAGAVLNTGDFLELKSDSLGTAGVGPSFGSIRGKVTVERYIQPKRAWRFLSMPTRHSSQTIKQAWQEGAATISQDPLPGFGTIITDNATNALSNGFDATSPGGPSVKYYDPVNDSWVGIASTNIYFQPGKAYMAYIRGNRQNTPSNTTTGATVLREKDSLHVGPVLIDLGTYISGGRFLSAGNPYASAVSLSSLVKTNLDSSFYLWDPVLTGAYGLGAYISLARVNGNILAAPSPPAGSSYANGVFDLQSGQGFFVRSVNAGASSVSFSESGKAAASQLVSRMQTAMPCLRSNLYKVNNGQSVLTGGVLHAFDPGFDDEVTGQDARSPFHSSNEFSILKNGNFLSIECRSMPREADTFFFNPGFIGGGTYRLEFIPELLGNTLVEAFLEDTYLRTLTPLSLSDTGRVDFLADSGDSLSYSSRRFRIVFKRPVILSAGQINLQAAARNHLVQLTWSAPRGGDAGLFLIERSSDGVTFSVIERVAASGDNSSVSVYSRNDVNPQDGISFYRIRGVGMNGSECLSNVAKVIFDPRPASGMISPNPVNGREGVRLNLTSLKAGVYDVQVTGSDGRVVLSRSLSYDGRSGALEIFLPASLPAGVYRLVIGNPDSVLTDRFILQK